MFYQTEAKPQGWRAVAVFDDRTDRLLYLGRSSTQVRANFTQAFFEVLDDEEYHSLQLALLLRPELGPLIPRSGGLRKVRWSRKGRGKRGGLMVLPDHCRSGGALS